MPGPVFDQRLSWKQAGGMGVRAHAAMDHIEVRQFAGRQAKEALNVLAT